MPPLRRIELFPAHWRQRPGGCPAGPTVVFDLDGVLSDAATRQHYLTSPRPDWKGFFAACGDDPLVDEVARLTELLDPDLRLVLLTARPMSVQPQTLAWLERYELRWDMLIMRQTSSYVPSSTFKRETVHELRAAGYDLQLAFEDDRRNVDMFHSEGVPCIYIHSGYYD